MGIVIRLNLVGNKHELNVVVLNDNEENHESSKVGAIANFNVPINKTLNPESVQNVIPSKQQPNFNQDYSSNEESNNPVIDLTDEPSDESENASPNVSVGYYVVERILGSRLNRQTNKHEFLLTLKNCSSTDNTWNPVPDSQPFDLCDPDSVLYVQKSEDAILSGQPEQTSGVLANESWISMELDDTQIKYPTEEGDTSFVEEPLVNVDLPVIAPKKYIEEIERKPFINLINNSLDVCEEKKVFDGMLMTTSNESNLKCPHCGLSFTGELSLKKHSRKCKALMFPCSLCPRSFTCEYHLKKHSKVHINSKEFRCTMCGYTYGCLALLKNHEKQAHHLRYQRKYSRSMKIKIKRKLGPTTKPVFECSVCSRGFRDKEILQIHSRTHEGAQIFACVRCGLSFTSEATLKKHELSECKLLCSVCGKSFKVTWRLLFHERQHQENSVVPRSSSSVASDILNESELSPCLECGKSFTVRARALVHKNIAHSNDSRYANCIVCGVTLNKFSLKNHMFRHTGERPLKCKFCEYQTIQKNSLKNHLCAKHGIVLNVRKRKLKTRECDL